MVKMKRHLLIDMGAARTRVVCVGDARRWNEPSAVRAADKPQLAVINGVAQILPELDCLKRQ